MGNDSIAYEKIANAYQHRVSGCNNENKAENAYALDLDTIILTNQPYTPVLRTFAHVKTIRSEQ